jgi:NAD-dependent dihydropyrimidine dehydrogenase PreA subunit
MSERESYFPIINSERCDGCGDCVRACPTGALQMVASVAVLVAPDRCRYCANCEELCPQRAINLPYEIVVD